MDGSAVASKPRSKGGKLQKVKFGSVTVMVRTPTEAEVQRNVDRSTEALARGLKRLLRPGVRLYPKKGVPLFYADEDHPGKIVRMLDGKRDLGVYEDGDFKVTG